MNCEQDIMNYFSYLCAETNAFITFNHIKINSLWTKLNLM